MQDVMWGIVVLAAAIALFAGLADRRRSRQEGLARIGWVPWSGVTVAALFIGVGALALALHK